LHIFYNTLSMAVSISRFAQHKSLLKVLGKMRQNRYFTER
jgi:hypothetical protein